MAMCSPKQREATWSNMWFWRLRKKLGSRSGSQGAEYWNERIRITEPFMEPWRLRLQATPSRHGGLGMPQGLGISTSDCHCPTSWEYCGNILGIHFWMSNSISYISFAHWKRLDVPPIQEMVIPVRHSLKGKTQGFFKSWKFITCLVLAVIGRFLFDSIRLLLRWGHSPLALDSTSINFTAKHARFLKKGGHFAHWLPGRIPHSTMMYNARLNVFIVLPVFRYSRFQVSLQMVIGWTDTAINTPAVQYICKGDPTTRQPSAGCFCEQKSIWLLGL